MCSSTFFKNILCVDVSFLFEYCVIAFCSSLLAGIDLGIVTYVRSKATVR